MNFPVIALNAVPQGRHSKHRDIMDRILADLSRLPNGSALKLPISKLDAKLANLRSALNRVCRAEGLEVRTSTDSANLYVWRLTRPPRRKAVKQG